MMNGPHSSIDMEAASDVVSADSWLGYTVIIMFNVSSASAVGVFTCMQLLHTV